MILNPAIICFKIVQLQLDKPIIRNNQQFMPRFPTLQTTWQLCKLTFEFNKAIVQNVTGALRNYTLLHLN